jgi:hypothetical protein
MTDDDERLAVIRSMIQHEDALRDQRFGWFLALNGLLFTALGPIWNATWKPGDLARSFCLATASWSSRVALSGGGAFLGTEAPFQGVAVQFVQAEGGPPEVPEHCEVDLLGRLRRVEVIHAFDAVLRIILVCLQGNK